MCKEKIYNTVATAGIWTMGKIFPEYFAKEPLRPTDRYIEYPWVLSRLPEKSCTILDIGCSGSMFLLLIKSLRHTVFGCDIRPYLPKEEIYFRQEDICQTSFPDNFFDVVTAVSTVEHIGLTGRYKADSMSSDISALNKIYKILKPYGQLLMTVPFGKHSIDKYHRVYDKNDIELLLTGFTYFCTIVPSPEADYNLALIRAVK